MTDVLHTVMMKTMVTMMKTEVAFSAGALRIGHLWTLKKHLQKNIIPDGAWLTRSDRPNAQYIYA